MEGQIFQFLSNDKLKQYGTELPKAQPKLGLDRIGIRTNKI